MVSHFVKQALLNISSDESGEEAAMPQSKEAWGKLAQSLGVRLSQPSAPDVCC